MAFHPNLAVSRQSYLQKVEVHAARRDATRVKLVLISAQAKIPPKDLESGALLSSLLSTSPEFDYVEVVKVAEKLIAKYQ